MKMTRTLAVLALAIAPALSAVPVAASAAPARPRIRVTREGTTTVITWGFYLSVYLGEIPQVQATPVVPQLCDQCVATGLRPGMRCELFTQQCVATGLRPGVAYAYRVRFEVGSSVSQSWVQPWPALWSPWSAWTRETRVSAAPLRVVARRPQSATVGVPFRTRVRASGGVGPYDWTALGLPSGLVLNEHTGIVSGTPLAPGASQALFLVTDRWGHSTSAPILFAIAPGPGTSPAPPTT